MTTRPSRKKSSLDKLKVAVDVFLRDSDTIDGLTCRLADHQNCSFDEARTEIEGQLTALVRIIGYLPAKAPKSLKVKQMIVLHQTERIAESRKRPPTMADVVRAIAKKRKCKESGVRAELKRIKKLDPGTWERCRNARSVADAFAAYAGSLPAE